MRILALDVGTKTIGVAVSDELGIAAHWVTTIKRTDLNRESYGKVKRSTNTVSHAFINR